MNSSFLQVSDLSFTYKNLEVFDSLSFVSDRRLTIFRGPSGCGKTTLLKLLSGMLKPTSSSLMPAQEKSCLVIQEDSLFPWLNGMDNIIRVAQVSRSQIERHTMYPLVKDFIWRYAYQMSYGQRRLVELFRAFIYRPKYLYLDEPFNFLDVHRIGLLAPFFKGEFLGDTLLTISTHHKDEEMDLSGCVFRFDGEFPVRSLVKE